MTESVTGSSSNRLTFGGLATGLDTNLLIETLISLERRPLDRLEDRRSTIEEQQGLYQDFNTKLLALRNAARALDNRISVLSAEATSEEFLDHAAISDKEAVLTATAASGATPGSYQVDVDSLATIGYQRSVSYATSDTDVLNAGRTLSIDYGGTSNIDITVGAAAGARSLEDLRDAINLDADNGGNVNASILQVADNDFRLVISAANPGVENDLTITGTLVSTDGFIDVPSITAATDASINVFGINITRSSNAITDAIDGVTLNLLTPNAPGETTTVSVSRDVDAMAAKINTFIDAYNDVHDFVDRHAGFDPETGVAGILSGDSTPDSIERQLVRILTGSRTFSGNPFSGLSQIGIESDGNGRFSLDQDALETALNQNPTAVRQLIGGDPANYDENDPDATDGVLTAMARALVPITRIGDGLMASRDNSFDDRIDALDDQIARFEAALAIREDVLVRRFSALERTVSALQTQQSFLSGSL